MAAQNAIVISYRMKGDKGSIKAVIKDVDGLKAALNGTMAKGDGMVKVFRNLTSTSASSSQSVGVLNKVFNMGVGSLTKWAGGLGAAKLALEGTKRLIESTEASHDLFASTMHSATIATEGFFSSIMNGNFTSFLEGLDDVIDKAKDAYQAMDDLGSFSARYNPKSRAMEKEISALRSQARTQKLKGDVEGAKATMAKVHKLEQDLEKLQRQWASKTEKAGYATLNELFSKGGVSFTKAQLAWHANPENFEEEKRQAAQYRKKHGDAGFTGADYISKYESAQKQSAASAKIWGDKISKIYGSVDNLYKLRRSSEVQNTRDSDTELGKALQDAFNKIYAVRETEADISMRNARNDATDARIGKTTTKTGKSGGKSSSSSYIDAPVDLIKFDQSQGDLANLIKKYNQQLLETTNQVEYDQTNAKIQELQELLDYMQDNKFASVTAAKMSKNIADSMKEDIAKGIEETVANLPPMEIPVVLGKPDADSMMQATKTAAQGVASALSSASTAMGQFGQKSEEAAQASAIMSIAASIAQLVAQFAAIPKGAEIWSWIAGTVAGTGALISSIAQIKSATAFANGGIVSGPTHALVGEYAGAKQNPEVIAPLNRLKDLLGSDDMSGMGGEVVFRIGDRELIGVLNRRSNYISRG